ncbi:MAG: hypothetical protein ACYDER_17110 [Ktedonobacteraceae bacterium]
MSWYRGDPYYPLYDTDCSLLISITSVSHGWTIRSFPKLPNRLIIDSGGYRFAIAPHEALTPKEVLERQLSLLAGERVSTVICARDYPILNASVSMQEKDKCITRTIASAYELKNLVHRQGLAGHIIPMAIVQGYDADSFEYCARELVSIGFPLYGLGSLAVLKREAPIMERVHAVASVTGAEKLHIFGVSLLQVAQALRDAGIHSIDSARPAKSAAYNEILYSSPFRRFGILETSLREVPLRGRIPRERRLSLPLACSCPVCVESPGSIMVVGRRANIRDRGVHNYFHLKRMLCEQGQV